MAALVNTCTAGDAAQCGVSAESICILCGSPRANGRSTRLARSLAERLALERPSARIEVLSVAELDIAGCIGCNACRDTGECVFDDGMTVVRKALDGADELHVVCPVYFAGPPSQMKALLDRLQPHFWLGTRLQPKRPAHLHVVGEGGDPYGFDPLVTICRSALAVAGFELLDVEARIGSEAPGEDGRA